MLRDLSRVAAAFAAMAVAITMLDAPTALCAQAPAALAAGRETFNGRAHQLRVRLPRQGDDGMRSTETSDGTLDEAQWTRAARLTGFSQFVPVDGLPAVDSTDVLVWYSATAIYFGIRAFEAHGPSRATVADRDQIDADDNVQILLGTFNDGRQATVFAVNPLGIQSDGSITESNQLAANNPNSVMSTRDTVDRSTDFVFQSRGRVVSDGYVVEVRIPFKSLKYQSADVQTWAINVVRKVQHSGYEDSWVPARRASLSFLGQSGSLEDMTGLARGLTLDLNPELTQRTPGTPLDGRWHYASQRPQLGGNARWGVTNNLTLSATMRPDFSQVESDGAQIIGDPRFLPFLAEKRPFFMEGAEQFATPQSLIYTRRILQPTAAIKMTGNVSGTNVAFLSAVDAPSASISGVDHPIYNLLRLQRDVGPSSKLGLAYTGRTEGRGDNEVFDVDGTHLFGGVYSVQGQYARSVTRSTDGATTTGPLWRGAFVRNGRHYAFSYSLDGNAEDFHAASGFIDRAGIVTGTADQRYTWLGAPGRLFETITIDPSISFTWQYHAFVHRADALEKKLHVLATAGLRGGWNISAGVFPESYSFDRGLFQDYRLYRAPGDTLPFPTLGRLANRDRSVRVTSPQGGRVSFSAWYFWGTDDNFDEWASTDLVTANYLVTLRPTERLRVEGSYHLQSWNRPSDGSIVVNNRIPRAKLEYQVTRSIFVRLVGEYDSFWRDALRDEGRTGLPIITHDTCNGGLYQVTTACQRTSFRGDLLFSYHPDPGTALYFGYGSGLADARTPATPFEFPHSLGLGGYARTSDVLFVKASYLFRT